MISYELRSKSKSVKGRIELNGSKSISNRVLIIRALSREFKINRLSQARDSISLRRLLANEGESLFDAGDAGTTYRFMCAFLALQPGKQILTGSSRMLQRPIGVLVEALRSLGAKIDYLGKKGYPPLQICSPDRPFGKELNISASVSSQFISALLLIAPTLPDGLRLRLDGTPVSRPYIQMTLSLMAEFGILYAWTNDTIYVPAQEYEPKDFLVEADWSAASYYYAIAALAEQADIQIDGLFPNSVQGDAKIASIMEIFGVQTTYNQTGIRLTKFGPPPLYFDFDFIDCPDIAQTLAVVCAALKTKAALYGLQTLRIKETDRIEALQKELSKIGARTNATNNHLSIEMGTEPIISPPLFETYEDHRMAMAFAPLALQIPAIRFDNKEVVNKSYPAFWDDLQQLGFSFRKIRS